MGAQHDQSSMTIQFISGQTIRFVYKNWQGSIAERTAQVISLVYGVTEWHLEPQWLLHAYDLDKNAERLFALRDIEPVE